MKSFLSLIVLSFVTYTNAFSDGAPEVACETMLPDHEVDPQPDGNDQFDIHVEDNEDGSFRGRHTLGGFEFW